MSNEPTKVAVSYSWAEEKSGAQAWAVGRFCETLKTAGIPVMRDLDRLKHGESISTFMRDLGRSDFLCIFLSDAYLRSPNCMYELLVAWQRSKDHPEDFRSRVKVWIMPSAAGIRKVESRLEFLDYWMTERERVAPLIEKYAVHGLAAAELTGFRRIKEFAEHVNEMLCFVADTLSPGTMEEFSAWVVDQFPAAVSAGDQAALAQVYANTVKEMEALLLRNQKLRTFIGSATHDLICQEGAQWKLCEPVKRKGFLASPHIEGIKNALPSFGGASSEFLDLEVFVGGIVVLALDPAWILHQRDLLKQGSVEYPALAEMLPLGDGQRASFLSLVKSALADGHARLSQVFGEPAYDPRRVDDPAVVGRGITEPDQQMELKKHFIRYVLGADIQIDDSKPESIELLFKRVNDVLRYAMERDRNPYFGTGPTYQKLSNTIRDQLKMADLLLIQPSGSGSEDELLQDTLFVFKDLHEIFEKVEQSRAAAHG